MSQVPQQPVAPQPKKRRGCLIAAIVIGVILLVILGSCMALTGGVVNEIDKSSKQEHTVTFKVTTDGKATVTYGALNGTSHEEIAKDWVKETKIVGWDGVSLMVQGDPLDGGAKKVTCEILIDGKSAVKQSGSGQAAMASCSASSIPK